MATWIFRNTVCQIWLADLKEGETQSSTDLKGQGVSTPGELPSPAAYLGSFSLPSAACQHYSSTADWQVLVRVMLSSETQQPKASRTHLDWGAIVVWKTRWECSEWNANKGRNSCLGALVWKETLGLGLSAVWSNKAEAVFQTGQVSCFPFPSPNSCSNFCFNLFPWKGF